MTKKANINIDIRSDGLTEVYSKVFRNSTVIGLFLKKSSQWLYPIYQIDKGERLAGYIYQGDLLSFKEISEILEKFAPKTLADFESFKSQYSHRIKYMKVKIESFQIIGEYSNREIITKSN